MDLNKMFGHKYLVTLDESWDAETPDNRAEFLANGEKLWYYEIRGKRGWVYPHNETKLAVVLPTRAARRLMKLMGAELVLLQHADAEMCFKADAKHTATLVRFIKPKRLRQLTAEQKAVLATRLAASRYQKPNPAPKNHGSEVERAAVLPGVLS